MPARDIIVMGASAGGLQAIQSLLPLLPGDLPASIFITQHRADVPNTPDFRPGMYLAYSPLIPGAALDGAQFEHGRVYVAPGGSHLLIERGLMRLEQSSFESFARPSIDALFRSAALSYGRRVVGVLLSGTLKDGTVGLWQIRKRGGITIVQDPAEAASGGMPKNAIANVPVHFTLPVIEIAKKIIVLVTAFPNPAPLHLSQPARVFIVEDERILAMNLENRLRELGYEVVGSVASGEAAIKVAESTLPDLVLMDVYLAGEMTGTEAARIIWERFQLPVVYLTAFADEKTIEAAKTSAPFGYVVKPYRPEQIHAAFQVALERHERELPN